MGVDAQDIETDQVSMSQFFPSVESTYQERLRLSTSHIKAIASTPGVSDLFHCLGRAEILRRHAAKRSRGARVRMQTPGG